MKKLILLLISLWMGTLPFYAKDGNTSSTTTKTDTTKKIPLHVISTKDKIVYSLVQPTAYAYLYDRMLSVDLSEFSGTFTVRITNLFTGEEVALQTVDSYVETDLKNCDSGTYQLDITSEDEWLQGEFTL